MKKDKEYTKVDFRIEGKDVVAIFPEEYYDIEKQYVTCYVHVGQHFAHRPLHYDIPTKATPKQYTDLKQELESIGYNLEVII